MVSAAIASRGNFDVPIDLAAALIEAVGTQRVACKILLAMRPHVSLSYCSIFSVDGIGPTQVLEVAAIDPHDEVSRPAKQYVDSSFYRADPLFHLCRSIDAQNLIALQSTDDISIDAYRIGCYQSIGVRERCSLLLRVDDRSTALNFYRSITDRPFSTAELDFIGGLAPLMQIMVTRHRMLAPAVEAPYARAARLFQDARLTERERQVLRAALDGLSNKQAAAALRLQPSTVTTYRERAYLKLGIARHSDLVKLLLHS